MYALGMTVLEVRSPFLTIFLFSLHYFDCILILISFAPHFAGADIYASTTIPQNPDAY